MAAGERAKRLETETTELVALLATNLVPRALLAREKRPGDEVGRRHKFARALYDFCS